MCGIFGYSGKRNNAAEIVFTGLKSLEYRGYDSWGIAAKVPNSKFKVQNDKKILVKKYVGKMPTNNPHFNSFSSNLTIGHTRWATHGGVTVTNAHPHLDCTGNLALVHNGIVENYQELKRRLAKKHKFVSATDTEVIVHLIEEEAKNKLLEQAVRVAFKQLEGTNAVVILDNKTGSLIGSKTGSPLVLGVGDGEYFLASDSVAFLPYTKKAYFLPEGILVSIGNGRIESFNISSDKKAPIKIQKISQETESANLSGFPHFMLKEIFEQPKVLKNVIDNAKLAQSLAKLVNSAFGTFVVGCGTASYAALFAQYLFSKIAAKHINFSTGSEFVYLEHYLTSKSLVIAISQSGETMDVLESIRLAKAKKSKVMALVNVEGSTLWRLADYKIPLKAGIEVAVCATKSFIAQIASVLLLTYAVIGKLSNGVKLIEKAARDLEENVLQKASVEKIKKLANKLKTFQHIYIIGRGLSYPAAAEAALKVKEISYIHSEGFAGGELKHGVIALIERGTPCIVFAPNDETQGAILSNAQELAARGGYIIGIAPENNEIFDFWLPVANLGPATIIPSVVHSQLLAYYLAVEKGLDPDKPRNLAKSVTVK